MILTKNTSFKMFRCFGPVAFRAGLNTIVYRLHALQDCPKTSNMYKENGYTRSLSGLIYAAKRLELVEQEKQREVKRHDRRYPELSVPGEKVQIDVKKVPYCCLISDTEECPFDKELRSLGIKHKLIAPRTPWHNGKVERSHRNDQRYFYDRKTFRSLEDFNKKLAQHLLWSNNKPMRTLKDKSPRQLLAEKLAKK